MLVFNDNNHLFVLKIFKQNIKQQIINWKVTEIEGSWYLAATGSELDQSNSNYTVCDMEKI